jgi:hypothetical protein
MNEIANRETVKQEILRALMEKADQLGLGHLNRILDIIVETVTFIGETGRPRDSPGTHFSALRCKCEDKVLGWYERDR